MRSAESLRYNLTVPRLQIAVVLLASGMTWAQTPRADQQGAQLGAAAEHLQQGRTEQTIRECKDVLAADPRSAPAHMLLGLAYLALGSTDRIADAKAELQQALDLDPELLWARFYLARLYFDQGLTEKAQEQLERGLKQSPGLPDFLSLLGEVRRELGDPGASVELNRKALEAGATMTPVALFPGACLSGPETGTGRNRRVRKSHSLALRHAGDVQRAGVAVHQETAVRRSGRSLPESHRAGPLAARRIPEPGASL